MVDPAAVIEAWNKFGIAVVFLLMYLTTVIFLIKQLVAAKKEAVAANEKVVVALTESTLEIHASVVVKREVKHAIQEQGMVLREFVAYMKGREGRNED